MLVSGSFDSATLVHFYPALDTLLALLSISTTCGLDRSPAAARRTDAEASR